MVAISTSGQNASHVQRIEEIIKYKKKIVYAHVSAWENERENVTYMEDHYLRTWWLIVCDQ